MGSHRQDKGREKSKDSLKADFEKRKKERNKSSIRDIEIIFLQSKIISAKEVVSLWKGKKENIAQYLQNFINYNREALQFLEIQCTMSSSNLELVLNASQMVGSAPIISPVNGKHCGNIIVRSGYDDDFEGILPIIKGNIDLIYRQDLQLNTSPVVKPPIYLECIRFIEEFSRIDWSHWKKFSNFYQEQNRPSSSTDWEKYAINSHDPNKTLKYPNKLNRLVTDHPEWLEVMYVLSIAIAELQRKSTSKSVRLNYLNTISRLKQQIPFQKIRPIKELIIHKHDPLNIQNIKVIGNNILKNDSTLACAWAFNITKLFERYVQYIFGEVMRKIGGKIYFNNRYPIHGERPSWSLRYLEPDIILRYGDNEVVVDAKYKSHMMNLNINNAHLRDAYREDLHQVLAYSSFSVAKEKKVILCYPCFTIIHKTMKIRARYNDCATKIILIGLPVNKKDLERIINNIFDLLVEN